MHRYLFFDHPWTVYYIIPDISTTASRGLLQRNRSRMERFYEITKYLE